MKLVFNQNISFTLVPILDSVFTDSNQVRNFGLPGNFDVAIRELALNQSFGILSKDSEFFKEVFYADGHLRLFK